MHRRKVTLAAAAVFAIGVAFAAQPTSRADRNDGAPQPSSLWVPGTQALMSAYEPGIPALTPPR